MVEDVRNVNSRITDWIQLSSFPFPLESSDIKMAEQFPVSIQNAEFRLEMVASHTQDLRTGYARNRARRQAPLPAR